MATFVNALLERAVFGVVEFINRTICRMNDLRSEFNSRNSVYNPSRFTALKMSGIVLYC